MRLFLLLSITMLLQACVSVPANKPVVSEASQALYQQHLQRIATIQQFSLQGRIGVQANDKGFSGSLRWQHDHANDNIALYSPLGGQVANIIKTAVAVTLEDAKGNSISAADAETLTQNTLGWRLPLTGLADWSLGRPTSNAIQASSWDEQGHLSRLKQDGWDIEYQNYIEQDSLFLPSKILLKSEKVNLKLLVDKWSGVGN